MPSTYVYTHIYTPLLEYHSIIPKSFKFSPTHMHTDKRTHSFLLNIAHERTHTHKEKKEVKEGKIVKVYSTRYLNTNYENIKLNL